MVTSDSQDLEGNEEIDDEISLKNAMYTSIIFVGGGLAFFWFLLFIIFSIRG